jgi:selenocysteine-specific translation elongation factor
MNIAKARADAESRSLKAVEEKIRAEALAAVAFCKQIAEAELARDTAMERAEKMAKLCAEKARKAAEHVLMEAMRCEQIEAQLLKQQRHFDQEHELRAQAERARQARIDVEPAACVIRHPRMTEMLGITAPS